VQSEFVGEDGGDGFILVLLGGGKFIMGGCRHRLSFR